MNCESKFEPEKEPMSPPDETCLSTSYFNIFHDMNVKVNCDSATFGLDTMNDEIKIRACTNDVCDNASASASMSFNDHFDTESFISDNDSIFFNNENICNSDESVVSLENVIL